MEIISAHELCCSGSTTLIVPPLTTIEAQLLDDCERLGIPAVAGSKVFLSYISFIHVQGEFLDCLPLPKFLPSGLLTSHFIQLAPRMFERAMEQSPRIVIANVEFLANLEVLG